MRQRAAQTVLAVALLAVLAGAATASAESISFAPAGPQANASAPVGTVVSVTMDYALALDVAVAQQLKLFSRAVLEGERQSHSASWTVGGETNLATDLARNAETVQTHGPGTVEVRIRWTLPANAPAGTYSLRADLRTIPDADSGAAAGTSASASFSFTLARTTTGNSATSNPTPPAATVNSTPTASSTSSSTSTTVSSTTTASSTTQTSRADEPEQRPVVQNRPRTTAVVEVTTLAPTVLRETLAEVAPELANLAEFSIVRDGETGDLLRIEDATETIEQKHVASDLGFILVETTATGRPVLFNVDTNEVFPVERPAAQVSNDQVDAQDGGQLSVTVQKNTGWIDVGFTDAYPGLPIQGVEAVESDGSTRAIPASLIWRDGGQLHFLDDPTITYTVAFVPAATPPPDQDGFDWTLALFGLGGVVLLAILVGVLVVAGRREAPK